MSDNKGDPSNAFLWSTVPVHRTGAATTDHFDERSKQLQAIRVLAKYDALDLLDMLFAPLSPVKVHADGKRRDSE